MSSAHELGPNEQDPRITFGAFRESEAARHAGLANILEMAFPIVADVSCCNNALAELGRTDLAMTQKATMRPVLTVDGVEETNNFGSYFHMYTGIETTASEDPLDQLLGGGKEVPISITNEQLAAALRRGSSLEVNLTGPSHSEKPALHRMFTLLPDFTAGLVITLSNPKNRYQTDQFWPELFVAHQIMAELVDVHDPYVLSKDGTVNDWYLRG